MSASDLRSILTWDNELFANRILYQCGTQPRILRRYILVLNKVEVDTCQNEHQQ